MDADEKEEADKKKAAEQESTAESDTSEDQPATLKKAQDAAAARKDGEEVGSSGKHAFHAAPAPFVLVLLNVPLALSFVGLQGSSMAPLHNQNKYQCVLDCDMLGMCMTFLVSSGLLFTYMNSDAIGVGPLVQPSPVLGLCSIKSSLSHEHQSPASPHF